MIKTLFKAFLGFKFFELIISIILIAIAYNFFPQPFYFTIQILRNIK